MGLWYLRRARFEKAEKYLKTAVEVQKKRNPNPYDGEALFYLGVVNRYLGKDGIAYNYFWKSTWNKAWADAGYYEAACISISGESWEEALDELERALISNSHNHQARAMKAVVLRKLGRKEEALAWIKESYKIDPFNYVCMVEEHLLTDSNEPLERMVELMHGNIYNYHETALDYLRAQLVDEAALVLKMTIEKGLEESPLTYYYLAYASDMVGMMEYLNKASEVSPDYCFPNRLEDAFILTYLGMNPFVSDARAPYLLGCLYYDKRQYDLALKYWQRAAKANPTYPVVWRNLALARFNKQNRQDEALEYMEKAFHLDETDARMLMELDQLYKRLQKPHQERLDFLQKYPELIRQRDDLVLEEITLLNQLGRYEEAKQKLDAHTFHPWEGGEGKVSAQYQICRLEIAKQLLQQDAKDSRAKQLLEECLTFPPHLGEGKLYGAQDNDFLFFLGRYEEGTVGPTEPAAAMYYNDAKPDKIFYAALCYRKLGQEDKARGLFDKLVNYGKEHIQEKQVMDYFAVSLPDLLIWNDSLDRKNEIHCKYMMALGYLGLGEQEKALQYLSEVRDLDINHQGVQALQSLIDLKLLDGAEG
jgi:tetratricopeptide (TPR) repeat protein